MGSRQSLLRLKRNFFAAWLAAALTVLSPVLAYANAIALPGGVLVDHSIHGGEHAAHHHHGASDQADSSEAPSVPHCPYCPGFAAGAALGQATPIVTPDFCSAAPPSGRGSSAPAGRKPIRIAQPRAPPTLS